MANKATKSCFPFNCAFKLIIPCNYILPVITPHVKKIVKENVAFMCSVLLRRGWRTSGCHSSAMLWEWQPDVPQPFFRQWQDCITVILLTNNNQCWKQKNHDEREFQSFLLCICPAFFIRRMRSVSLWLGLLHFGHEHIGDKKCTKSRA